MANKYSLQRYDPAKMDILSPKVRKKAKKAIAAAKKIKDDELREALLDEIDSNLRRQVNSTLLPDRKVRKSDPENKRHESYAKGSANLPAGYDVGRILAYGRGSFLDKEKEDRDRHRRNQQFYGNYLPLMNGTGISGLNTPRALNPDMDAMNRWYREQERFRNMMNSPAGILGTSISIGDDDQYAFGQDTGVSRDFEYLRKREAAESRMRFIRGKQRDEGYKRKRAHDAKREFTHWYDALDDESREQFDLVQHYGGGAEGREYAREEIGRRREKERKHNRYNYLRKLAGERRDLYDKAPWMKTLVKSGLIEQKHIPEIAKRIDRLSKLPVFGSAFKLMARNPASAALAGVLAYLSAGVKSDKEVASMGNGLKAFGPVDNRFREVAMATGLDERGMQKAWFDLQSKYGPASMSILAAAHDAMKGRSTFERIKIAEGFGLDENMVRIADLLNGEEMSKGERATSAAQMIEKRKAFGFSAQGGFFDFLDSLWLTILGNAQARDASNFDYIYKKIKELDAEVTEAISRNGEAEQAAESAIEYDRNGTSSVDGDVNVVNNISIDKDGNVSIDTDVERNGGSLRRTANVDHISAGVTQ